MPDDQNTAQNPISEKPPIPASPQEPMVDIPVPAIDSMPSNMPLEALETPINADIPVSLNNDNPENTPISTPSPEEVIPLEPTDMPANPASNGTNEPSIEPVSESAKAPETGTAQIPVNEPLASEPEVKSEPLNPRSESLESAPVSAPQPQPVSAPVFVEPQQNKISLARELLVKARNAIQFRKRKKLDRVMTLFLKKSKITNNEVKDFLHVSDATAERYLNVLEKENKIKQNGKTGKAVSYSRI
jgi:hypothetical protein